METVRTSGRTQHRSVRISDEDWQDLESAAEKCGLDRAKVINQLLRWYLRRPRVKLPERPASYGETGPTTGSDNPSSGGGGLARSAAAVAGDPDVPVPAGAHVEVVPVDLRPAGDRAV